MVDAELQHERRDAPRHDHDQEAQESQQQAVECLNNKDTCQYSVAQPVLVSRDSRRLRHEMVCTPERTQMKQVTLVPHGRVTIKSPLVTHKKCKRVSGSLFTHLIAEIPRFSILPVLDMHLGLESPKESGSGAGRRQHEQRHREAHVIRRSATRQKHQLKHCIGRFFHILVGTPELSDQWHRSPNIYNGLIWLCFIRCSFDIG